MLGITRRKGEEWRALVERHSRPLGLQDECLEAFDRELAAGAEEAEAAWAALYEWDCLPFDL